MKMSANQLDGYTTYLKDKYRPPSRGGNTHAWHQHVLTIGADRYSFLALGRRKWVYAGDSVTFEWNWDETGKYRNIDPNTVVTSDKNGKMVVRGERGSKKWRTAGTRMPASRREQRD